MNKKLKSVRQLFNQYGNDQELDFLTLVYERDTGRMMAENEEEGVLDKFEQHISELLASSHDYWAGKEVFQSLVLGNK